MFRGYFETLGTFRKESAADALHHYNVDELVGRISALVEGDHFDGLLDLWGYLCDRLFSRLDTTFTAAIDRLGVSLQRLWVVNNVVKGRMDAVDAFFTAHSKRLRPGDQDHSPDLDWTPWLSIGYIEEPQRHPDFAYFFGPEWAASVVLSLRNAVSVVFQHTPRPALLQFDILRLQLEQAHAQIASLEAEHAHMVAESAAVQAELSALHSANASLARSVGGGDPVASLPSHASSSPVDSGSPGGGGALPAMDGTPLPLPHQPSHHPGGAFAATGSSFQQHPGSGVAAGLYRELARAAF